MIVAFSICLQALLKTRKKLLEVGGSLGSSRTSSEKEVLRDAAFVTSIHQYKNIFRLCSFGVLHSSMFTERAATGERCDQQVARPKMRSRRRVFRPLRPAPERGEESEFGGEDDLESHDESGPRCPKRLGGPRGTRTRGARCGLAGVRWTGVLWAAS